MSRSLHQSSSSDPICSSLADALIILCSQVSINPGEALLASKFQGLLMWLCSLLIDFPVKRVGATSVSAGVHSDLRFFWHGQSQHRSYRQS